LIRDGVGPPSSAPSAEAVAADDEYDDELCEHEMGRPEECPICIGERRATLLPAGPDAVDQRAEVATFADWDWELP
jgi:hypothetical protein